MQYDYGIFYGKSIYLIVAPKFYICSICNKTFFGLELCFQTFDFTWWSMAEPKINAGNTEMVVSFMWRGQWM